MKNLSHLDKYRQPLQGDYGDEHNGAFLIRIKGELYTVIASNGRGWDHVSISHKRKIPSWKTMCELKDLFFEKNEAVMQLHPQESDYINLHPNCLHLWRPQEYEIAMPPIYMV